MVQLLKPKALGSKKSRIAGPGFLTYAYKSPNARINRAHRAIGVKAMRDARYDLLIEIKNQLREGKSTKDTLNQVEALAKEKPVKDGPLSTPSDHYKIYRQRYAEELLRIRNTVGDEQAVKKIMSKVDKPWPQLRKL